MQADRRTNTGLQVPPLSCGGSQLGGMFAPISDEEALATLGAAWDAGYRWFDTSPFYGRGRSEHLFGRFLAERPAAERMLSTKVGRVLLDPEDPETFACPANVDGWAKDFRFDYSYDGVMQSFADSCARLGTDRFDALFIHDLDVILHGSSASVDRHFAELDGGFRALEELRAGGHVGAIGAGINVTGMIERFVSAFDLDVFLVAMPYTLLDQPALERDLPLCVERSIDVLIGAPFASGILATGPVVGSSYRHAAASEAVRQRAAAIQAVCARHDVPLRAAALQFPLAHEAVVAVIPGPRNPAEVEDSVAMVERPIPTALWAELRAEGLLHPEAPTPE